MDVKGLDTRSGPIYMQGASSAVSASRPASQLAVHFTPPSFATLLPEWFRSCGVAVHFPQLNRIARLWDTAQTFTTIEQLRRWWKEIKKESPNLSEQEHYRLLKQKAKERGLELDQIDLCFDSEKTSRRMRNTALRVLSASDMAQAAREERNAIFEKKLLNLLQREDEQIELSTEQTSRVVSTLNGTPSYENILAYSLHPLRFHLGCVTVCYNFLNIEIERSQEEVENTDSLSSRQLTETNIKGMVSKRIWEKLNALVAPLSLREKAIAALYETALRGAQLFVVYKVACSAPEVFALCASYGTLLGSLVGYAEVRLSRSLYEAQYVQSFLGTAALTLMPRISLETRVLAYRAGGSVKNHAVQVGEAVVTATAAATAHTTAGIYASALLSGFAVGTTCGQQAGKLVGEIRLKGVRKVTQEVVSYLFSASTALLSKGWSCLSGRCRRPPHAD